MGNVAHCQCQRGPATPIKRKIIVSDVWSPELLEFDVLGLAPNQLRNYAISLLQTFYWGCGSDPDAITLTNFASALQDKHQENPFHNFAHAVDATQLLATKGRRMLWDQIFSPMIRCALVLASLCHDVGHPGVSNAYLVNIQHNLALLYNDRSPLENMHCSCIFELLAERSQNIFCFLPRSEVGFLRGIVIDVILHTDQKLFNTVLAGVDGLYRRNMNAFGADSEDPTGPEIDLLRTDENRLVVMRALLVGCDGQHQARIWDVARAWGKLRQQEVLAQSLKEQALAIPVGPLTPSEVADDHLAFLGSLVAPMLIGEVRLFRPLTKLSNQFTENVRAWGFEIEFPTPAQFDCIDNTIGLLTNPKMAIVVEPEAQTESRAVTEPCSEPSCLGGVQPPFVREVRRWREARSGCTQQRELVLVYVVSEMFLGATEVEPSKSSRAEQPILLRYTVQPDSLLPSGPLSNIFSTGNFIDGKTLETAIRNSKDNGIPIIDLHKADFPRGTVTAEATVDAANLRLSGSNFDDLLQTLQALTGKTKSGRPKKTVVIKEEIDAKESASENRKMLMGLLGWGAARPSKDGGKPVW